jgi:hypothetical protein
MWTKKFWQRNFDRAVSAWAGTLLGLLVGGGTGLIGADWRTALSHSGMTFVCTLLAGLAGSKFGKGSADSPAFME